MNSQKKCKRKMRIILAEDHVVVRDGIKRLINDQLDMHVVAEASNGQHVMDMLQSGISIDILLSDINMPNVDGLKLFERIAVEYPAVKTVVLSMLDSEQQIKKSFQAGCLAYVSKSANAEELIYALRQVGQGKMFLCSNTTEKLIGSHLQPYASMKDSAEIPEFSDREIQVLELIVQGLTNLEIAEKIYLSKRTVEGHRQSLIDKSASRNTAVLIHYAMSHGLIT